MLKRLRKNHLHQHLNFFIIAADSSLSGHRISSAAVFSSVLVQWTGGVQPPSLNRNACMRANTGGLFRFSRRWGRALPKHNTPSTRTWMTSRGLPPPISRGAPWVLDRSLMRGNYGPVTRPLFFIGSTFCQFALPRSNCPIRPEVKRGSETGHRPPLLLIGPFHILLSKSHV